MLDYVTRMTAAQTMEDAWVIHCDAMARFGFNRLIYGMTRANTPRSLGPRDDFLILTTLDQDYMVPFLDEGLYLHAPMVRWALENRGAGSWRWIEDNATSLTEKEREVVEFNLQHGVKSGFSISFFGISAQGIAAIALIADPEVPQANVDAMWENRGEKITAMNNVFHLKVMNMPYDVAAKPLTERQRETLEWVGAGKTTQDIGTIMGLTPATVEKHLRLAREALDVETTAQAVVKASFQKQIYQVRGIDQA